MKCKDKCYKEGQVFKALTNTKVDKDTLLVLHNDDGSYYPYFVVLDSSQDRKLSAHIEYKGLKQVCLRLNEVIRIYPPEKSNKVTITCEGKTVEISRESAKALNLI